MSLFNPYVLLGIVLAVLSSFGGGYFKGKHDENTRQQLEIAKLNAEARQKEQALTVAVTQTATALRTTNEKAKQISKERDLAIASGALKLQLPVKTPICPVHASSDTPVTSGDSVQATAELDREVAKSLVAITDQGDANTRQLNACIDAYNAAYQTLKGSK